MWQPGCRRGGLLALVIVAATLSLMWAVPEAAAIANDPGLWATPYSGPGNGVDQAAAIAASPDGAEVFVTGTSDGGPSLDDYTTIAYDAASGARLWFSRYEGMGGADRGSALAVSPDGSRLYVTGTSDDGATGDDFATISYDVATGHPVWIHQYDGERLGDTATAIGVSPDGSRVFVTGTSAGAQTGDDYATVAYDAATGTQLWVARYDGQGQDGDNPAALGISPDGSKVFVTGGSWGPGQSSQDFATVAYDAAAGTQLWLRRYNGPHGCCDSASALGISSDGSKVFVTGTSYGGLSKDYDYATVAYDAVTGAELWVRRYNGVGRIIDEARALGVSPDGSTVYVTGDSWNGYGTYYDYVTIAYDADTAVTLWTAKFTSPGPDYDYPSALAVSPDGARIYVTGKAAKDSPRMYEWATVAYDAAAGSQAWSVRSGESGDSVATDLAVDPSGGRVYVTGSYFSARTNSKDYGTVAYPA